VLGKTNRANRSTPEEGASTEESGARISGVVSGGAGHRDRNNAAVAPLPEEPNVKAQRALSFLGVAVLAGFLGAMVEVHSFSAPTPAGGGAVAGASSDDAARADLPQARALADQLSLVFEHASEKVGPSVVPILSEQTVAATSPFGAGGDSFRDFFGDEFFKRFFGGQPGGKETVKGLGSGVIVSPDGYILTNNHVVEGASKLTVMIGDKKKLEAKVIGTDPQTDVAVIKVEAQGLPAAELGDSDNVRVGQWVLAVGNPFQLMHTVTSGIISAKGRSSVGLAEYEDFIQTDASINPGNSGGALADLDGKVIAINTAISTPSGGSVGIGFAIPINMAKNVMDVLINKGHMSRGYLGVLLQNVDESLAKALGLEGSEGVIVADVTSGSPAAKAGLKRGDVILTVDGKPVGDTIGLRNVIARSAPGTSVNLGIVRDGKRMDVTAPLGERPNDGKSAELGGDENRAPGKLGLTVQDLTPDIASQLGYDDERGALVSAVEQGSAADEAGLRRGDLILAVNRSPIASAAALADALRPAKSGDAVAMLVRRGDNTFYVAVTVP
jgi:serine protease Do